MDEPHVGGVVSDPDDFEKSWHRELAKNWMEV
jgi:hypothetical protein